MSADPAISTANASTLGVAWMSPIGSALDSPSIQYDPNTQLTLSYQGAANGFVDAVNVANGQIVWSDYLGGAVTSSALIENGNVWVAPETTGRLYKLDASTGAVECSSTVKGAVLSSPVIATPPGGEATVYLAAIGHTTTNGPVAAYSESDCQQLWQWSNYVISGQSSGVWSPLSYGVDAAGVGLLLFGSANPDSQVYALNANTGALVWDYATYCPATEDWDVGAGVDISAPGVNGFADGMAYVEGKDGIFYALDLTTGALVWSFNFGGNSPTNPTATNTDALSTPALSGTTLVFGDASGLYALNAITGAKIWFVAGTGDIESSPIIAGPAGSQVVAYGDLNGYFHVASLASGAVLYTYQTGKYITSSPADVDGNLLIASNDGFLYDFAPGGVNGTPPTTAISSPAAGATLANPNGDLTISGTATGAAGVSAVDLQIQMNGAAGQWFDQSSNSFAPGLSTVQASLASPGATSTTWSLQLPVPIQAANYQIYALAVGTDGLMDGTAYTSSSNAADVSFSVQSSPSAPVVKVAQARVVPGKSVTVSGSGFTVGETVSITAETGAGTTVTLGTAVARKNGSIAATKVTIPTSSAFGTDLITLTGGTSGRIGVGSVYVSNNDPQFGYGPTHLGSEANDKVIVTFQGVNGKLVQDWAVAAAGSADTTPAVYGGVAYFGDESGNLYAVSQTTGQPVFTDSVGSAIESSPAVDGGNVFFGDDGGNLEAVNASTGAAVWTASLSGKVSTPAVAGGLVYVGTSNGVVAAFNEVSGALVWTISIGGAVTTAPGVDTTAGLAFATNNKGLVRAVSTSTHEVVWTRSLGGALTGVLVTDGDVFVASSSGAVYGLVETTGKTVWTANAGSAVVAPPIQAYGDVAVGTSAGNLSYYDPTTGALVSTETQFGKPITGITYTNSVIVMASSAGYLGIIQGEKYLKVNWLFQASAKFLAPVVILNGDVFVLGSDGLLRAFTTPGRLVT